MTRAVVDLPPSFTSVTTAGSVRAAMHRNPAKLAVVFGEQTRTYSELVHRIDLLRNAALTELGLERGSIVAIVARNCIEYIEVVCGVPDSGAAVATVNPRLSLREIAATIEDAGASVVFTDKSSSATVRQSIKDREVRLVEFGEEYEMLLANSRAPDDYPQINEWDIWTIPYTSGTTGQPKGVLLSHRSRMLLGLLASNEFGCFGPEGNFLAMTPMNHGGGLGFPVAALSTGGSIEILDKFDPIQTLRKLRTGRFTGIFMVPTHFQKIFALPPPLIDEFRRPSLSAIISNAAPLPQAMKEKIVHYFGEKVLHEIYSSTEAGLVTNLRPEFQLTKVSCVGVPFAHTDVEVRRDDGSRCGVDEVGEVFARSPMLFNGYWNRAEETDAALRDGWVSVGDLARQDAEGFLYIVDRKKDMVISGGVNIYPREIEEVLFTHPAIADVAVVGVPDEIWGERLKAFAVVREGSSLSADGVLAFCEGKLAAYKIPRELCVVAELPRNANGKVLKASLRQFA